MKAVEVDLEDVIYLRLRVIARLRGTTVTSMFTEHAYQLTHIDPDTDIVLQLWAEGLSDSEMGARLEWTNERVKRHRSALKLPANRRTWINERKAS